MLFQKKHSTFKVISLLLALLVIISVPAYAAVSSAKYIDIYGGYVYSAGNGELQIWSNVSGLYPVDVMGMAVVSLCECSSNSTNDSDWECIYHFYYNIFPEMVTYNASDYGGCVTYEDGTVGYYYKAQITIFVEHEGTTEARTFWTSAKRATYYPENA